MNGCLRQMNKFSCIFFLDHSLEHPQHLLGLALYASNRPIANIVGLPK
jgi:hypothetical protein